MKKNYEIALNHFKTLVEMGPYSISPETFDFGDDEFHNIAAQMFSTLVLIGTEDTKIYDETEIHQESQKLFKTRDDIMGKILEHAENENSILFSVGLLRHACKDYYMPFSIKYMKDYTINYRKYLV